MGYQLEKNRAKVNHLVMDDLKRYGKNDKELNPLIKTVWQSNKHMKMKFDILKCDVVSLQRGEKTRWEGIQLPNVEKIFEDTNILPF